MLFRKKTEINVLFSDWFKCLTVTLRYSYKICYKIYNLTAFIPQGTKEVSKCENLNNLCFIRRRKSRELYLFKQIFVLKSRTRKLYYYDVWDKVLQKIVVNYNLISNLWGISHLMFSLNVIHHLFVIQFDRSIISNSDGSPFPESAQGWLADCHECSEY